MTITYPNGAVLKAIVLSHENNEIRAIAAGCDDVLVFTRIHGTWISEELEPIAIEFAWQHRHASAVASESACICPKTLAARLIQSLLRGSEGEEVAAETLCGFSPEGNRIAVRYSELQARTAGAKAGQVD
jgi:hypothetical protein